MAPEDRRAALIAATVPLLYEHGLEISTRQIAQAAGVAEGTIFGVFNDKHSLVVAALMEALDPQPTLDAMAAIDAGAGLRERLSAAATLINERFARNARLMTAARSLALSPHSHPDATERMARSRHNLLEGLTEVIAPDAGELRRSPATVARMLLLFCGANTYGPFGDPRSFDGDEIVSLLLDGLLIAPAHRHHHGGA
ncbi:TetR family transcriptional regulator [Actinoplanes friuliensis DSM 7358]|uniref:TetR family transcriptional regulator n=2 Tax=Actinoplanes friuliensis TaxID=196914 RepID=U5WAC6_9ACTN|nr:TetR family transcriptional regulator [Actinoplanes friuliensis DSM 7358]